MRVAVIFFGLARALPLTIDSIRQNIFACNADRRFSYHTIASLNMPEVINSPRAGEMDIRRDPAEIFLLNADCYAIARQDDRDIAAPFAAAQRRTDCYDDGWASVRNLLHQLVALRRAWRTCNAVLGGGFDYFIFLRPDLLYLDPLPLAELVEGFAGAGNIALPAWHSFDGYNDRFAVADAAAARCYAERLEWVAEFCESRALHPESLLRYALEKGGCKVWKLPMLARRVRANGAVVDEAFDRDVIELPYPKLPGSQSGAPAQASLGMKEPEGMIENLPAQAAMPREGGANAMAAPAVPVRRGEVDGFPRILPLNGVDYLAFLRSFHQAHRIGRYLEIGTQFGKSLDCATGQAIAIDPAFQLDKAAWSAKPGIRLFETTSDGFFSAHDPREILGGTIDLAFIDGMHLSDYVLRDFVNVERHCAPESVIVLHDALPMNFEMTERERRPQLRRDKAMAAHWTGDVWRIVPLLARERPDLRIEVLDCPPTGLVLIHNLDPNDHILPARLDDFTRVLSQTQPTEAEFWSFIDNLEVLASRQLALN